MYFRGKFHETDVNIRQGELPYSEKYGILSIRVTVLQGGKPPLLDKEGGGADGYIRSFKPVVFGWYVSHCIAYLYR